VITNLENIFFYSVQGFVLIFHSKKLAIFKYNQLGSVSQLI